MRQPLERRTLLCAGAIGGIVVAAGCTRNDLHPNLEELGRSPRPIRAARATTLLEPVGEEAGEIITPYVSWFVRGTRRLRTLEAADAAAFSGLSLEASSDVTAPDGKEFLLARIESQQRFWGDSSTSRPAVIAGDQESWIPQLLIERSAAPVDRLEAGTYLLLVPEGAAREDAVLELDIAGRVQQLSLLDGSMVSTDLEHLHERHDRVRVAQDGRPVGSLSDLRVDAYEEAPDGRNDTLGMSLLGLFTEPIAEGDDWPAEGMMLTWVGTLFQQSVTASGGEERETFDPELASAVLELEDGTLIESPGLEGPSFSVDRDSSWLRFEVPLDIEAATLRIEVTPHQRWDGIDELLAEATTLEAELLFD